MWMSHEKQDIKTDQPTLWFHLDEDGLLDHVLLVVDQEVFTELPQSVSCVTSLLELMGCFSAFSQFYDLRQKNVFQFIEEICFRSLASKENLVKYYKMCSQLVWCYYILQYF